MMKTEEYSYSFHTLSNGMEEDHTIMGNYVDPPD